MLFLRISRVCKRWNRLASECILWKKLDLSRCSHLMKADDSTVRTILKKRLPAVEELNMDGWRNLSDKGVKVQKIQFLRSLKLGFGFS